ncbi:MAG: hypothetical protein ABSA75_01560 [Candidatus Bathyarchaeia archaeon]
MAEKNNEETKTLEHKVVNCPHCGKIIPDHVLKGESARKARANSGPPMNDYALPTTMSH